jgi:hypothetical protein
MAVFPINCPNDGHLEPILIAEENMKFEPTVRLPLISLIIMLWAALVTGVAPVLAQPGSPWQLIGREGSVQVQEPKDGKFRPAKLLEEIFPGTRIRTGPASKAKIFNPQGAVLMLGEETSLQIESGRQGPGISPVQCLGGSLRFIVNLIGGSPSSKFILESATALIEVDRGDGILLSNSQDRLMGLDRGSLVIQNKYSKHRLMVGPMQQATSQSDGVLKLSRTESSLLHQELAQTRMVMSHPPPVALKPSSPAQTPMTLADQTRQPWAVLPPVIQSPNIWIMETYRGRVWRPRPRF